MFFNRKRNKKKEEVEYLSKNIDKNINRLKEKFKDCSDLVTREFKLSKTHTRIFIFYIDGIVDKQVLQDNVLSNILINIRDCHDPVKIKEKCLIDTIKDYDLPLGEIGEVETIEDCVKKIVEGNTILFIDSTDLALCLSTIKPPGRTITQPVTESNIRGPFEGFTENLRANTSLIRKRLKSNNLKMENINAGKISRTNITICYLKHIVDDNLVKEVKKRLDKIEIDTIIDSGYIEHLIEDSPLSVFPQMVHTERPDTCTAALSEGRVVLLVDGSPFALIVPGVFIDFLTAPEDYYSKFYIATFVRMLRYTALFTSLITPGFYIALSTFHRAMIPTTLLIRISAAHAEVPFSATIEVLLMEMTFELLREAGLRLQKPIGSAVSIVGALVIGQGAVKAGLVSQEIVIIVALTGISSFAIPVYSMEISIRLLRFALIILSSMLGILGLVTGLMIIFIHLVSLRSFGVPYLSPLAPMNIRDWQDVFYKVPIWANKKRPTFINPKSKRKQKGNNMPKKTNNSINKV
ncbi:MAG: spore germination protein [Anaeromicrobium sp.]|jgi:spore germination protein KA|uniref:spore germination protein n=1 Tax=Anaeromicrobium sp. TaxID=1929132 RepID=UPI0025D9FF9B|nr:spore germination protein [Anaeromicrobium sp.]MCT4594285.1 spore germination protein [Anaeromicrobium sp.]